MIYSKFARKKPALFHARSLALRGTFPIIPSCGNTNKPEYKSFKTRDGADVVKYF